MSTILVTGGAGFIGSAFARYIHNKYPKYKLIVIDSLTYAGNIENLPIKIWEEDHKHFEFWYGNILNASLVGQLVSQADYVVHFAAESHVTRSIFDNKTPFETDVLGTQQIANSVLEHRDKVKRFIHISTSEVYGTAINSKMDEEHPLNPMSPYAAAKAGADRLVYSYWATYRIPAVIIRPFNNYGPYQHLEKVLPRFITSCILGEQLRVHGTGQSSRDFLHTKDTCRAVDMVLHASDDKVIGEVFNIGSGEARSVMSIAEDVISLMGKNAKAKPHVHVGDRPGQVVRHIADYSKIKKTLGWDPKVKWSEGLEETVKWYSDNKEWWWKMRWMREIPIVTSDGKHEYH